MSDSSSEEQSIPKNKIYDKNNLNLRNLNYDLLRVYLNNKVEFTEDDINKIISYNRYNTNEILQLIQQYGYSFTESNIDAIAKAKSDIITLVLESGYVLSREELIKILKAPIKKLKEEIFKSYTDDLEIYLICLENKYDLEIFDHKLLKQKIDFNLFKQILSSPYITVEELNKFDFKFSITSDLFHVIDIKNTNLISYISSYGVEPDNEFYKKLIKFMNPNTYNLINYSGLNLSEFTEYVFDKNSLYNPPKIKYPTTNKNFNLILETCYGYPNQDILPCPIIDYFDNKKLRFNNKYYFNKEVATLFDMPELENKFIKNIHNLIYFLSNKYFGKNDIINYKLYKISGSMPKDIYNYEITNINLLQILETITGYKSLHDIYNISSVIKNYFIKNKIIIDKKIYFNTELCNYFSIPDKSYISECNLQKFLFFKLGYKKN